MEYLLKAFPEDPEGKRVLITEKLGTSCEFLIKEIFSIFPDALLVSFYRLSGEYEEKAISFLETMEDPQKKLEMLLEEKLKDLTDKTIEKLPPLIVDGWNIKGSNMHIAFPEKITVFLIERSVTNLNYREMYQSDAVISVSPLKTGSLIYSGSLSIYLRKLQIEIDLLYTEKPNIKYFEKTS
ncbi:hypothetical protein NEFER03_0166 [Nematocida sp. LUAm3]|nr:hypothetical protein NEFER03_0166 [Nematocida sp. LUAm3]